MLIGPLGVFWELLLSEFSNLNPIGGSLDLTKLFAAVTSASLKTFL